MLSLVELNRLWQEWQRSGKIERFGQFALNRLNPSDPNPDIFYEQDDRKAYDKLASARTIFCSEAEESC